MTGAGVSTALGLRQPDRIIGIHLNYIPGSFRPFLETDAKLTAPEEEFFKLVSQWSDDSGAYAHLQRTRPQTAAYGLNDSPAGLAAWILEKFREWSDCDGHVYRRFSADELLANVTLYWITETIHSWFRLYLEGRKAPHRFGKADFVRTPTAVAHFPKELPFPPRVWIERGYNVQRWTEMPRGGHFAAAEEPELLAEDLCAFFRRFRKWRLSSHPLRILPTQMRWSNNDQLPIRPIAMLMPATAPASGVRRRFTKKFRGVAGRTFPRVKAAHRLPTTQRYPHRP